MLELVLYLLGGLVALELALRGLAPAVARKAPGSALDRGLAFLTRALPTVIIALESLARGRGTGAALLPGSRAKGCRCAEIQRADARRHFVGCPLRKPLEPPPQITASRGGILP